MGEGQPGAFRGDLILDGLSAAAGNLQLEAVLVRPQEIVKFHPVADPMLAYIVLGRIRLRHNHSGLVGRLDIHSKGVFIVILAPTGKSEMLG
ncbi:hypothetical protein D3C76_1691890 [compost metagenome]